MPSIPPQRATRAQGNRTSWLRWLLASAMAALAACKSPPPQAPTAQDSKMPSRDTAAGPAATPAPKASAAATPRDYRKDAASHLYSHNQQRIYKGKLPPMLYAIGVLEGLCCTSRKADEITPAPDAAMPWHPRAPCSGARVA